MNTDPGGYGDMKYGFEILVNGNWQAVSPPGGPPPYCFDTKAEACTMARVLYRELVRFANAGDKDLIRVVSMQDA